MKETILINKNRIPYLKNRIEKLNKKARKLGCREMVLTIGNEETVTYVLHDGRVVSEEPENTVAIMMVNVCVEATLEYEIPIIDGWELICTFDIMPTADPLMKHADKHVVFTSKVPDKTLPVKFQNKTEIHCEHCGINRFRNHSMLLRNTETGEYKEVGSTCVKDFFGHDPKGVLFMSRFSFVSIVDEFDEHIKNNPGYRMYTAYPLKSFLSMTAACIRNHGWVSKGLAWDKSIMSTAEMVDIEFNHIFKSNEVKLEPNDDDEKLAEDTISYFENLDPQDNDYLNNCVKIIKLGYVPDRMTGVACSMIITYKRTLAEKAEAKNTKPSEYIGNVGERINLRAECVFNTQVSSMYGISDLYIFVTPAGDKIKTFYSGYKWSCEVGETYHLTGTIKKHEEYRGEKSTLLTRVNIVS